MALIFWLLRRENDKSKARWRIEISTSFKQSKIIFLWRCKVEVLANPVSATVVRVIKATYLILLSLLAKKRPRILIAKTLNEFSLSIWIIVKTASYNTALPVFFVPSVLVTTYNIYVININDLLLYIKNIIIIIIIIVVVVIIVVLLELKYHSLLH